MKDHRLTDQDLVAALRGNAKGTERAFTELYARHAQRTYAFILRMTGDAKASEDLMQEVWLKFYDAARADVVVTNPVGFLLMIARNHCLNWKRDTKPMLSLEGLEEMTARPEEDAAELTRLINLALELLDYEYREAFVLKYYQGYDYQEMSTMTGASVDALRNRVWRAKEKVKSALRPHFAELGIQK